MTKLLNESQVEEIYGIPVRTLRKHRLNGNGIPYCKIGSRVYYLVTRIEKYITDNTRRSTSEIPAG